MIQPVRGILAIAADAKKLNKKRLIVSLKNASEASTISDLEVIGVENITQLVAYLRKEQIIDPYKNVINIMDQENKELDWRAWSIWHYFELFDRTSRRVLNRWKRAQLWF